jgi:FkbM family methyltransferase
MNPATQLKDCRHGRMLFLWRDQFVGKSLDLYGEFSEGEAAVFAQILAPGQIAIEVGANIGAHTIQLAKLVGPQGAVLAFEPQRVIFQLLAANVALNEQFHVRTFHAAVGREAGTLTVPTGDYEAALNFGGVALSKGGPGETVPVMTLDSLSLPSVRLLKIDVEGMEGEVLSGARGLIAQHRPILYVENDRRERSAELIGLIDALGYDAWWHLPRLYNPKNFNNQSENVFGGIISINLLCTPKEAGLSIVDFRKVTGPDDWWQDHPAG